MDINNLKTTLEEKGHLIKEKGQTVFTKKTIKESIGISCHMCNSRGRCQMV